MVKTEKTLYNKVHNRKNKLLPDGTALIQIEAYLRGLRKYFSTNIYVKPDEWDNKKKLVKTNRANSHALNRQIANYIGQLEKFEMERRGTGKPFTLAILADFANGKRDDSFTQFMASEIEKSILPLHTISSHRTTLDRLNEFKENILFEELNFNLLSDFERFLIKKELGSNTVYKYFKIIRKYTNIAIDKELMDISRYPFRKFKVKQVPSTRGYLTPEQLEAIEQLVIPAESIHLQKIVDMFLFSCYTGLRFGDLVALTNDSFKVIDGKQWIDTTQHKTSEPIRIPMYMLFDGKPIEIFNRYKAVGSVQIFDKLTNQYVNRCLKEIAALAGISTQITFHMARHTQATYLLYKGVSVTSVQTLLGHKNIKTTQIYAKVMDKTLTNELGAVQW